MILSPMVREELRKTMLQAYPDKTDLEILVLRAFERNLSEIAEGLNLTEITFKLIEWANSRGKIKNLLMAIHKDEDRQENLRLQNLINDLLISTNHEINIVLLVMNHSEAKELDSETVFLDYNSDLRENFRRLRLTLKNNEVINWVNHYQSTSEEWQPFNQDKNITQLINEVIEKVESESIIVSRFINISDLNGNNHDSFRLLKKLRDKGCIIIMDVISMQHPKMQRLFKSTALDASSNTLLLMVAPIHSAFDVVRSITGVIKQRIDIEFHRRLLWNDSKWMKAADNDIFRNWLIGKVPSLLLVPETENVKENVFRPWDNYGKGG
jgi:hypothetical protein